MPQTAPNKEIDALVDEIAEGQKGGASPETQAARDILDQDEIDQLLGELAPEKDERLKEITPERIAQEWEQLSETARSVVMNASDEKFSEITEKYKHIPDTRRKTNIMIIMRRLIKSNNPLALKITSQEGRLQKAA